MDSPKAIQKTSRIIVTSVGAGVKPSSPARCPSWKIHTRAPNTAVSESALRARALTGRTTLPVNRNSSTKVVRAIHKIAQGRPLPTAARVSISAAADPPTRAVLAPGAGTARIVADEPQSGVRLGVAGPGHPQVGGAVAGGHILHRPGARQVPQA